MKQDNLCAIIVGGGASGRYGVDKLDLPFGGATVAKAVVRLFAPLVAEIIFVAPRDKVEGYRALFADQNDVRVVEGGISRTESVKAGLRAATKPFVLVHDAARPNASPKLIAKVIEALLAHPDHGVIPVMSVTASVVQKGDAIRYLDRSAICEVQTPQGFDTDLLRAALETGDYTDEGSAFARLHPILTVEGEVDNRKLTYPVDYWGLVGETRTGVGYDIHRLMEGRPLKLGGVAIPAEVGLLGHSDADVLLHAVMDALLSTAGMGDIGDLFPPDDPRWEGADSRDLLAIVLEQVANRGATPTAVSVAVIAQRPRLGQHKEAIRTSLAALLHLPLECVGLTVTTNEGVDLAAAPGHGIPAPIAAKDAIAAFATVTVNVR